MQAVIFPSVTAPRNQSAWWPLSTNKVLAFGNARDILVVNRPEAIKALTWYVNGVRDYTMPTSILQTLAGQASVQDVLDAAQRCL